MNLIDFINKTYGSNPEISILTRNKIKHSDVNSTLEICSYDRINPEILELFFNVFKIKITDILMSNFLECTDIECNYIAYFITGEILDLNDIDKFGWTFDYRLSFIITYEYEVRKLCGDSVFKSLI